MSNLNRKNTANGKNTINRRRFLKTAGVATAAAGLAPRLSFAADDHSDNILVFIFQRGGIDGLSFLAPMDGHADRGNYETLRANGTLIPSANLQALSGGWGLHPRRHRWLTCGPTSPSPSCRPLDCRCRTAAISRRSVMLNWARPATASPQPAG